MSIEVNVRKGEPVDRALRRLKKRLDRDTVIIDVRANRYFEKPSQTKRRKKKELDFNNLAQHETWILGPIWDSYSNLV